MTDRDQIREIAVVLRAQADQLLAALGDTVPDSAIRPLAVEFCKMDDDQQAQFFVEVARIMDAWGSGKRDSQAWHIGNHLATCACSTEEAREFVRMIAARVADR
jgi:hypothetical protein